MTDALPATTPTSGAWLITDVNGREVLVAVVPYEGRSARPIVPAGPWEQFLYACRMEVDPPRETGDPVTVGAPARVHHTGGEWLDLAEITSIVEHAAEAWDDVERLAEVRLREVESGSTST